MPTSMELQVDLECSQGQDTFQISIPRERQVDWECPQGSEDIKIEWASARVPPTPPKMGGRGMGQ